MHIIGKIDFEAFKKWIGAHCSIISSSRKELVIKDSEANARLRGCRMFEQKRVLTVSIIE